MTDLAIHIFDPASGGESSDENVQTHACSIRDSADILRDLLSSPSSGMYCFSSAGIVPDSDQLTAAADTLTSSGAAIGILPADRHSDLTFVWRRLPAPLAGFVAPPESRGTILVETNRLSEMTLSEKSVWPLQEIVIRTALQNSSSVLLLGSKESSDNSPLPAADIDLPELVPQLPGRNRQWMAGLLKQLNPQKYLNGAGDSCEAEAVLAGLLQINDYLDESHNHSQSIEGQGQDVNGDYWHGIMHRREPDYGNSKYWFRRVGQHPCFTPLSALAEQALDECHSSDAEQWKNRMTGASGWNPAAFIDFCELTARSSDQELTTAAQRIQWAEMLLLLGHSFQQACRMPSEA